MEYSLAKKLKDAGFPQYAEPNGSKYALPIGIVWMQESWRRELTQPEIPCRIPTLRELIDAVFNPKGGFMLSYVRGKDKWRARIYAFPEEGAEQEGDTAEEAVANLYLALHPVKE